MQRMMCQEWVTDSSGCCPVYIYRTDRCERVITESSIFRWICISNSRYQFRRRSVLCDVSDVLTGRFESYRRWSIATTNGSLPQWYDVMTVKRLSSWHRSLNSQLKLSRITLHSNEVWATNIKYVTSSPKGVPMVHWESRLYACRIWKTNKL